MTKNTKLYKIEHDGKTIIFRTLASNEIAFLNNINNIVYKYEQAAKLAIVEGYDSSINFMVMHQIGEQVLEASCASVNNDELFKLTVEDYRARIMDDTVMNMMFTIMDAIPSTSLEYLSSLTFNDLIEIMCMIERRTNKKLFDFTSIKREQGPRQEDHNFFDDPDSDISLADKIKEDQKYFKENK
jgi:hypothetical protein